MSAAVQTEELDAEQLLDLLRLTQAQLGLYRDRYAAATKKHNETIQMAQRVYAHLHEQLDNGTADVDEIRAAMTSKQAVDEQREAATRNLGQYAKTVVDIERDVAQIKKLLMLKVTEP